MRSILDMTDLESSVIFSLLSHKKQGEEGGYWCDALDGGSFGSDFYALKAMAFSPDTLPKIEESCRASLNWMVKKGLVKAISVASKYENGTVKIKVFLDDKEVFL